MKSPFTGKEMTPIREWRTLEYRKEQFNVMFHFYRCEDSGEQFKDEHFSQLNYNQIVNQYRVNHSIPFPEQIKAIRDKYELSAAKMSDILGMGANSWRNYENGEVPSKVHANLIQMISLPSNFLRQLNLSSDLEEKEKLKIMRRIERMDDYCIDFDDPLLRFKSQPEISTGFKAFDRDKLIRIVQYFAAELKPFKTKLNKLLFYVDFVHFREVGQSITGLKYTAIQYGPVPHNYDILFGALAELDYICIDYAMSQYGEVERIVPKSPTQLDRSLFTESELKCLKLVVTRFQNISASDIAEISHQERAWKDNVDGKHIIPFYYAFDLETI